MHIARIFSISFISLVVASTVLSVAPVQAQSDRLQGWVARPGTQWSSTLTVNPGETINLFMKYTNTSSKTTQKHVVLREVLPKGVTFKPGSAYLYTPADPDGTQQANTLPTSGIAAGILKPGESASVQFQIIMPASSKISCGKSTVTNNMTAETRTGKTFTTANRIIVDNQCPITTQPSTTTTSSAPNTTTTTTSSSDTPTVTTAVADTTSSSNAASNDSNSDESKDVESANTLVETGFGQVFSIFAIATVVGVIAYRLVLQKRAHL